MIAGGLGEEGVFGGEERGPFGGSTRPGDSERCRAQASRSAMARTWSSLFTPCPAAGRVGRCRVGVLGTGLVMARKSMRRASAASWAASTGRR